LKGVSRMKGTTSEILRFYVKNPAPVEVPYIYKYGPAEAKQDVNRTVFASSTIYVRDVITISAVFRFVRWAGKSTFSA
jgi:hypothetical protein